MKKAYVFPGQGAQFVGMGKDMYENSELAKELFEKANEVLKEVFPEFNVQITTPDEKMRRVGQSIAAASLPATK